MSEKAHLSARDLEYVKDIADSLARSALRLRGAKTVEDLNGIVGTVENATQDIIDTIEDEE